MGTIDEIATKLPGGWKNIRSLGLKTPSSITLPIYQQLLKTTTKPAEAKPADEAKSNGKSPKKDAKSPKKDDKSPKKDDKSPKKDGKSPQKEAVNGKAKAKSPKK